MQITKPQIERILETLPIGYYCGKDIKVKLSDDASSFYNFVDDEITIGAQLLMRTIAALPDTANAESDVRCLLYHEVSHAILTPKMPMTYAYNCFEDERIETLLANYYRDVDFKQFIKRANEFDPNTQPQTADEYFFRIVRFRHGPKQFTDRVEQLIEQFKCLSSLSRNVYRYSSAIDDLYYDVCNDFQRTQMQHTPSATQNDTNSQDDTNFQNDTNSHDNANSQDNANKQSSDLQIDDDIEQPAVCHTFEEAKRLIDDVIKSHDTSDISTEIQHILSSYKKQTKTNGSAINAYSGIFNPRSVVRDDYKYFVQQNRAGHIRAYSKLHLNLFIDESSSFKEHDHDVNVLLKALVKFERSTPDFSFTLISCGRGQRIRNKNDRIQHSDGGTYLTSSIFDQYRQVQQPAAQNINIVMYDGACCYNFDDNNFPAFDHNNCVVITDPDNEQYVKVLNSAKVIVTHHYSEELFKHVLFALKTLTK